MSALAEVQRDAYVTSMMEHLRKFSPLQADALGSTGLPGVIQMGFRRSQAHGFTSRSSARFFLELMFLLGSEFDTDPQYPWAAEALAPTTPDDDPALRALALHQKTIEYLHAALGPQRQFVMAALERAADLRSEDCTQWSDPEEILAHFWTIFPEKCEVVGSAGLQALLTTAFELARTHNLPVRSGGCMLTVLMFSLGHRVVSDPSHPWVARLLGEPDLSAEERLASLEAKTRAYLRAVLAAARKGKSKEGPDGLL